MSKDKVKVVFINYGPYSGCSGVHIHFLANTLVGLGHECHVLLPNITGATEYFGKALYPIYNFRDTQGLPAQIFENALLHVWTTRELTRIPTAMIRQRFKIPYLVHLEDNEILISSQHFGVDTLAEQKIVAKEHPEKLEKYINTNPLHFEPFMRSSSGVTCIIQALEEFVPQNVPRMTFWPACEEAFFHIPLQRNMSVRASCNIDEDTFVLVYPGAMHEFTGPPFEELLLAVEALHAEGFSLKILRSGIENYTYTQKGLELYRKYVVHVGNLEACELPSLMAFADILVQPGSPSDFDTYRFPSKVPFFLASGRPVILPRANVAAKLEHGKDCFLLETGTTSEICQYLKLLMTNVPLARTMGLHGRAKSRTLFSWEKAANSLIPFYQRALAQSKNVS